MNPDYKPYDTVKFAEIVQRYQQLKEFGRGMYDEAMWQYADMATGGDGGPLGFTPEDWAQICVDSLQPVDAEPTTRSYNYPGYPDEFFADVLAALSPT